MKTTESANGGNLYLALQVPQEEEKSVVWWPTIATCLLHSQYYYLATSFSFFSFICRSHVGLCYISIYIYIIFFFFTLQKDLHSINYKILKAHRLGFSFAVSYPRFFLREGNMWYMFPKKKKVCNGERIFLAYF